MKKLIMTVVTVAMVITGALSVSAAEVEGEFQSNMDSATYLETRTAQIEEALAAGKIDEEQAALLLAHITEVAETGAFGRGPENSFKGEGNAECVLGDNSLGIFRSESAGQRTGAGNGVGQQLQDGTGAGQGNRGGKGNAGQGNQSGAGAGQGFRGQGNDGVCVVED